MMVTDAKGNPIPALAMVDGVAHKIACGATTNRNANPMPEKAFIYGIYSDVAFYFRTGDANVVATTNDHYFPAQLYYDPVMPEGHTHIAVLRAGTTDGTVWISVKD